MLLLSRDQLRAERGLSTLLPAFRNRVLTLESVSEGRTSPIHNICLLLFVARTLTDNGEYHLAKTIPPRALAISQHTLGDLQILTQNSLRLIAQILYYLEEYVVSRGYIGRQSNVHVIHMDRFIH